MGRIIFIVRETAAAAVVLLPMFFVLHKLVFRSSGRSIWYFLFSCYLAALWALVGLPNVTYVQVDLNLNWIPFVGMLADLKNCILNVLLFLPLGLFLPALWEEYRTGKKTILLGFRLSLSIELLQIFTYRATDINDLIANTLGAALGFLVTQLLPLPRTGSHNKDLWLVMAITGAVMFFVHPFLSALAWKLIG